MEEWIIQENRKVDLPDGYFVIHVVPIFDCICLFWKHAYRSHRAATQALCRSIVHRDSKHHSISCNQRRDGRHNTSKSALSPVQFLPVLDAFAVHTAAKRTLRVRSRYQQTVR
jgi:hypothetical protein